MSYTINGIGTHLYGKDRELTREDQCDQCGSFSALTSYDSTNYFVVLFIPIIPLGQLRVLDHCGHCQQWKQMPLKKWEELKEESIRESLDAMRTNPSDPEAIKAALVTATQFQDEGILLKFKQVAENFRADGEVQSLLGATLSYFGRNEEAVGAYEAAVAADNSEDSREQLALEYSLTGQPEKAEPFLSHVWSPDKADKIGFVIELVRGYQAKGDHRSALAKLDKIAQIHPQIAEDREFQKIVKQAEKYERKGAPVRQASQSNTGYKEKSSSSSIAKWIFPAAVACGLLAFVGASFFAGMNREVVLVNGLDQPYTATIAGTAYELQPKQVQRIAVAEGDISFSANIGDVTIPEETHSIKTAFFGRLGSKKLFVINPDRSAIINKEEVIYTDRGRPRDPEFDRYLGEAFYEFDDIEYQFERPPQQIEMSSSASSVVRDYVDLSEVHDLPETEAITQLAMTLEPNELVAYLRRRIEYGSTSQVLLNVLADRSDPAEVLTLIEDKLNQTPVNLEVHRTYQQMMESSQPDHDLEKEYAARLAKNPNNGDLIYLLARVSPDAKRRVKLLQRAVRASPPSAYAYNAQAFEALSNGNPNAGLEPSRIATQMEPENIGFKSVRSRVLEAAGKYDQAIALSHESFSGTSALGQLQQIGMDIPVMVAAGQGRKAEEQVNKLLETLRSPNAPKDLMQSIEIALLGNLAYARGSIGKLSQLKQNVESTNVPVYIHVALNEVEAASQKLIDAEKESTSATDADVDLTIYIAAKMAGKTSIADKHLARAIKLLQEGDKDHRLIGAALSPTGQSNPAELKSLGIWPEEKRVFMAALAMRHPKHYDEYSKFAKKLNHKLNSPYLLIKKLRRP